MKNLKRAIKNEVKLIAIKSLDKKFQKQGLSKDELSYIEYEEMLKLEMEKLTDDTKKVAGGFGAGVVLSMLLGF